MPVAIPINEELTKNKKRYSRIQALIDNDEKAYGSEDFCLRFPNEPTSTRETRKRLFIPSFQNISLDLLTAPKDAIFKETVRFEFPGANNPLSKWFEDVTLGGDSIPFDQYIKDVVCVALRAYGTVFTVIDKPRYAAKNIVDEVENGSPYLTCIHPCNVRNWSRTNNEFDWFAYDVSWQPPWIDPLEPQPQPILQTRIWTRTEYIVLENGSIVPEKGFVHNFGFVPVVVQPFILPPTEYDSIVGSTPFFTTSNLIIFANNIKFIADFELVKHGNSILLVPENAMGLMNTEVDDRGRPKTRLQDTDNLNVFAYQGEERPEYLTKDLQAVPLSTQRAYEYFFAAINNERSMRAVTPAVSDGTQIAESGVSKMVDMQPVMAGLRATSDCLQSWSEKVIDIVKKMFNAENAESIVEFPKRFDIGAKQFQQRLAEIKQLIDNGYPSSTGLKTAWKSTTGDLTQDDKLAKLINEEIDSTMDEQSAIDEDTLRGIEEDAEFEDSISSMPDDEKERTRAQRKLDSVKKED